MKSNKIDVVLGLQWGDEGKGKVVDVLTPDYKIIARFQGGPNAGHSLVFDGDGFVLHTVPSGIFREGTVNVIGNGVVIDPVILMDEIRAIEQKAGLSFDRTALDISARDTPVRFAQHLKSLTDLFAQTPPEKQVGYVAFKSHSVPKVDNGFLKCKPFAEILKSFFCLRCTARGYLSLKVTGKV